MTNIKEYSLLTDNSRTYSLAFFFPSFLSTLWTSLNFFEDDKISQLNWRRASDLCLGFHQLSSPHCSCLIILMYYLFVFQPIEWRAWWETMTAVLWLESEKCDLVGDLTTVTACKLFDMICSIDSICSLKKLDGIEAKEGEWEHKPSSDVISKHLFSSFIHIAIMNSIK